jgi:hypothetical protein
MRPKLFRKPHCGILLQNSILNFFKATENYIDEDANESTQTRTFDVGVIEIRINQPNQNIRVKRSHRLLDYGRSARYNNWYVGVYYNASFSL